MTDFKTGDYVILTQSESHCYCDWEDAAKMLLARYFHKSFVPPNGVAGQIVSASTSEFVPEVLVRIAKKDIQNMRGFNLGKYYTAHLVPVLKEYVDVVFSRKGLVKSHDNTDYVGDIDI
jgi:hypothetical protein